MVNHINYCANSQQYYNMIKYIIEDYNKIIL